jgi:predicted deacylase
MSHGSLVQQVGLGERGHLEIEIAQSYVGASIKLPATVIRGLKEGPTVTVCAALHGDEINGTGIVRDLITDDDLKIEAGALLLIPVINIPGFERHSRYLPDRRDLNRCFPGSPTGSFSSRYAHAIFTKIIPDSDYLIDLHTAAVRRTNFPNVRADFGDPAVREFAKWMGCEINVNSKGPKGSLRRAATESGHPTIVLECGEVWKVEPTVVEYGANAVKNALFSLGMTSISPLTRRPFQIHLNRTKWIRAEVGGMLQFHISPGDLVEAGQPIATNTNLLGVQQNSLFSPLNGVVLGMTTLPFVTPGDPICHIGVVGRGIKRIRKAMLDQKGSLRQRLREDLASSIEIVDPDDAHPDA